jgi:uncharacterized membrane protein YfcA
MMQGASIARNAYWGVFLSLMVGGGEHSSTQTMAFAPPRLAHHHQHQQQHASSFTRPSASISTPSRSLQQKKKGKGQRSYMTPNDVHDALSSTFPSLSASALSITNFIAAEDDPLKYAFMFPIVTGVAITCQLAGIGGAALLSPIFLLVFPLLGPDYPLQTAASAIACALLTECFGFMSGLTGYWRRGLVDWGVAAKFWGLALPAALGGALLEPYLASQTTALRAVYATLMISLCLYLTFSEKPVELPDDCPVPADDNGTIRVKETSDGTVYTYLRPDPPTSSWKTIGATISGASLTGLLGVGIGEVILPQLVRIACVPLPVAAGTSVAVVVLTALTAAGVQFFSLATELAMQQPDLSMVQALQQVIPWDLVQFTIPGAVLGGQIAPWIASRRLLDDEKIESVVAALFGIIGVAFAAKAVVG